jgi:glycosyltransferase involved in cell wall biosynthesis
MNILICGPYNYKNEKIWGGVEAVINNLNEGFCLFEPNTSIKIASGTTKAQSSFESYKNIIYIKQPKVKLGSVFISRYPIRIKDFIRKSDFDILNAHSIDFAYYGLERKQKLVLTLHGIPWEEKKYIPLFQRPFWNFFYVKKLIRILRELKFFVSITPYSKELIQKKTHATIFDICNPIPDNLFNIIDQSQEKRIFYMGVISRRKNLLNLIKSLVFVKNEINDIKLIIAGKISDQTYFSEIMNYVIEHNLSKNVKYIGKISEKEKYIQFSKMQFLVLPSLQETAPMVISETFAAGKPAIASNICGIPYMLDEERNGLLIDPNNVKEIADKIIYLIKNPDVCKSMGNHCKQFAIKHHSLKNVVRRYNQMYKEVIAQQ